MPSRARWRCGCPDPASGAGAFQVQQVGAAGSLTVPERHVAVERRALELPEDPLLVVHHLQSVVAIDGATEAAEPDPVAADMETNDRDCLLAHVAVVRQ